MWNHMGQNVGSEPATQLAIAAHNARQAAITEEERAEAVRLANLASGLNEDGTDPKAAAVDPEVPNTPIQTEPTDPNAPASVAANEEAEEALDALLAQATQKAETKASQGAKK